METSARKRRNKMPNIVNVKEYTKDDIEKAKEYLTKMFLAQEKLAIDRGTKPEIYIAKRQPTTKSGGNYFTFHYVDLETGRLYDITYNIAKVIGVSLNDKLGGTIYRSFGNMDMGFQTLYEMFGSLGDECNDDWQSRYRYRYI
jgi:hypothetical protein